MPRLIDADALETAVFGEAWYDNRDEDIAYELIQRAPTVEPERGEWKMTNREMTEKALRVCERNKQLFSDLEISDFGRVCNEVIKLLFTIKLQEDYGLSFVARSMVQNAEPNVYVRISDCMYIASMGEKYRRTISWPADGRQPIDEVMLVLSFPTSAYIFGDSYPKELFQEMWDEIKTYSFKYVDDANHDVYFPIETAAPIANAFNGILKKYRERYRDEANLRRAAELRRELEKLDASIAKEATRQR